MDKRGSEAPASRGASVSGIELGCAPKRSVVVVFCFSDQPCEEGSEPRVEGPPEMGSGVDHFSCALISSSNPHSSLQDRAALILNFTDEETETQGFTQPPADTKKPP